jgi:hypothetical protein
MAALGETFWKPCPGKQRKTTGLFRRMVNGLAAANAARTTVNCLKWFEAVGPGPKPLSFPL